MYCTAHIIAIPGGQPEGVEILLNGHLVNGDLARSGVGTLCRCILDAKTIQYNVSVAINTFNVS